MLESADALQQADFAR